MAVRRGAPINSLRPNQGLQNFQMIYKLLSILQIIVCTLLVLAGSILLTSGQIAYEEPGLPFGYYTISLGKKRTCIQCLLVLFSPITLLLVRLQHEIVKKKWQRLQAGIYILQKIRN